MRTGRYEVLGNFRLGVALGTGKSNVFIGGIKENYREAFGKGSGETFTIVTRNLINEATRKRTVSCGVGLLLVFFRCGGRRQFSRSVTSLAGDSVSICAATATDGTNS